MGYWRLAIGRPAGYWTLRYGLLAIGYWIWAIGYWIWAMGDGILAMGYGVLAIGYWQWGMGDFFANNFRFICVCQRFILILQKIV